MAIETDAKLQDLKLTSMKHESLDDFVEVKIEIGEISEEDPDDQALGNHEPSKIDPKAVNTTSHQCHICDQVFKCRKYALKHIRLKHREDEERHRCDQCSKAFLKVHHLRAHKRVHTGEHPFKCKLCPRTFALVGSLNYHVLAHTNSKCHQCPTCGKSFHSASNLTFHTKCHSQEMPFKCNTCSMRFTILGNLNSHIIRVHKKQEEPGTTAEDTDDQPLDNNSSLRPHTCSFCNKNYTQRSHLSRHLKTHVQLVQ